MFPMVGVVAAYEARHSLWTISIISGPTYHSTGTMRETDMADDMTLPGLVSRLSIEQGSVWPNAPDSREWKIRIVK